MKRFYRHLTGVVLIMMFSCSSGKKAYEHGDYYDAVMKSIARLRQNPDHKKSKETLRTSYPLAVQWEETQAKNQITSDAPFKYKNALGNYQRLNDLAQAIQACPGALKVIPAPKQYYKEIADTKGKAAQESYQAGIDALMKGDRNDAKQAYFNFSDAQNFSPGYKDAIEYMAKAKDVATLKVVMEQIEAPTKWYKLNGDFFEDEVEEYLNTNYTDMSFIHFYTPAEAQTAKLQTPDQILRIQFDEFTIGLPRTKETTETFTRDSVKIGERKLNGETIPVYGTVSAKLTTTQRQMISSGTLSMTVVDGNTQGVLTHRKFQAQYVWSNSWGHYNGDDRALSDDQLALCKRRDVVPPPPQDMFQAFTKPAYDQLVSGLNDFYSSY